MLVTTAAAYYLGGGDELPWLLLLHTIVGTALVAGGASALNQFWERDTDRLMRRTRIAAAPRRAARIRRTRMWFGVLLSALGIAELALGVNQLTALVAALTLVSYVLLYTPLKLRTSLSTIVGAVPGALPAVIGWTAATNTLSIGGWVLFGDRVHVADAALPRHRLDVPRRLRARGHSAAAGDSTRRPHDGPSGGAVHGGADPGELAADGGRASRARITSSARSCSARS